MRLIPPKTKKKFLKGEKEIEHHYFSHRITCWNGSIISAKEYLLEMIPQYKTPTKALSFFVAIFPCEKQGTAYTVFGKYLEEEEGLKIGKWINAEIYILLRDKKLEKEIELLESNKGQNHEIWIRKNFYP